MGVVHLYVHGRGRGHGSRCRAVAEHLRAASFDVRIFAGRDAVALFAPGDAEPVSSLMPGDGLVSALKLKRRLRDAVSAARKDDAIALVSDGDLAGAWAGRFAKIPSIALGHGLVFSHTQRPEGLPARPWRRQATKARISSMGSHLQVAVNFVPLRPRRSSTRVARPILRDQLRAALGQPRRADDEVLCYFRDGNGGPVLRALAAEKIPLRLFAAEAPQIPGVQWEPLDPDRFTSTLLRARGVVSSAGSQLISECVALGIPQLALYDAKDDEQRLNVGMLKAADLGLGCAFSELGRKDLHAFLNQLEAHGGPRRDPWADSHHTRDAAETVGDALAMIVAAGPAWKRELAWSDDR